VPEAAFANLVWGLASYRQGDPADALARFEASLLTRDRIGDTNGVAAVLQNLANLCTDQNDWAADETHFTRCLDIRRKVGDVAGAANALNGLGNVWLGRADYDRAAATFGECLDIFEGIGAGFGIAVATLNLGQIETERHHAPLALDYLKRAREAALPLKARDLLADITAAEARAHVESAEWEKAAATADEALADAREIANPGIEAKALWARAAVTLAAGDAAAARDLFGKGVDAARTADLKRWEARALLGRAVASEAAGDPKASLHDLAAAEDAFGDHTPQGDLDGIGALRERLSAQPLLDGRDVVANADLELRALAQAVGAHRKADARQWMRRENDPNKPRHGVGVVRDHAVSSLRRDLHVLPEWQVDPGERRLAHDPSRRVEIGRLR
jgi:tetratricopeptide (TPR) repeat protein